jgi:hypothetical protein
LPLRPRQRLQKEGFRAVEMLNIPAQGHSPPQAEWLKKAIEFIDGKK